MPIRHAKHRSTPATSPAAYDVDVRVCQTRHMYANLGRDGHSITLRYAHVARAIYGRALSLTMAYG